MVSFKEYASNRFVNKSIRQSTQAGKGEVIGGYVPGEERIASLFGKNLEQNASSTFGEQFVYYEAGNTDTTTISKTPIVFGKEAIGFLMHLPTAKWGEALSWLYGQGLKDATDEFKKNGKIEDIKDVTLSGLGRSGEDWTFEGVNTGLSNIVRELTTPRAEGGTYAFDLLDSEWIPSEYKTAQGRDRQAVQWRCKNFMSPSMTNVSKILTRFSQGISAGFLGRPENTRFSVPNDAKRGGRPSTKNTVFLNFNGDLVNYAAGEALPIANPDHLKQFIDPRMLRNSEGDKSQVIYRYKSGGSAKEMAVNDVPLLLPGKIFARHSITAYDSSLEKLQEEYNKHISHTPLASQPVISTSQLQGVVHPEALERIHEITQNMMNYLPDSGDKFAAQEISPQDFANQKSQTSVATEPRSFGTFSPAKDTKQQEKVNKSVLGDLGISEQQYKDIVSQYFLGNDKFKILGPDDQLRDSPLLKAVHQAVAGEGKREPADHADALQGETESMIHQLREFLPNLAGLGVFQDFVKAKVAQKQGNSSIDPKQLEVLWHNAEETVVKRAKAYVRQVSQLDLGVGTRRQRDKIKKLSADSDNGTGSLLDSLSKNNGVVDRTGLMDLTAKGYKKGNYQWTKYDTETGKVNFNTSLTAVYDDLKLRQQEKEAKERGDQIPLKATGTDDEGSTLSFAKQNAQDSRIKSRTLNVATLKELKKQQDAKQELDFRAARKIGIENANKILSGSGLTVTANDRELTNLEKAQFLYDLKQPAILSALDKDNIPPEEIARDIPKEPAKQEKPETLRPDIAKKDIGASDKATLFPPHLDQSPEVYLVNYFGSHKFRDGLESNPEELRFAKNIAKHFVAKSPKAGQVLLASIARAEQSQKPSGTAPKKPTFSDEELEDLHNPQSKHTDDPVGPAPVVRPAVTLQPSSAPAPVFKRRTARSDRFGDYE